MTFCNSMNGGVPICARQAKSIQSPLRVPSCARAFFVYIETGLAVRYRYYIFEFGLSVANEYFVHLRARFC
jgi:hypothetical protein